MDEKPTLATRRAILGASALGLAAGVAGPSGANVGALVDVEPPLQVVADRPALAAHRAVAPGTRVVLAEQLRLGEFVARAKNAHAEQIAADPYQAFFVVSSVDRDIVWVRDFTGAASLDWSGAKGDGIADDAPCINAMLANTVTNAFRIEGGRDHFLAEPVRIGRAVALTGAGVRNSVFTIRASIDAIAVSLPSDTDHGLCLADFGIVNGMPPGAPRAGSGIRLDGVYLGRLSNIRTTDCWNGVHATRSGLTTIAAIHVNGSGNAGLLFDGGRNFDVRVADFTLSGCTYAIRMQDMCDEMIFTDGVCSSSRYALYTNASAHAVSQRPEFCRFARVSFDNCTTGIDLSKCVDFVFEACFISCRPGNGVEIGVRGPAENIQFVATTFFNNAGSAAVVGAHAVDIDFLACKFVSNGTAKPDTFDTLVFASGCGSFSLAQSRFRQGWDVASMPRYQVRIEAGGAGAYSLIGNHFAGGGRGALLDERRDTERSLLGNIGL